MTDSTEADRVRLLNRREAIQRVTAMLGGAVFVGGTDLLAAVEAAGSPARGATGKFSVEDIAFLDEIAETILPATRTPGAKAARTGAFMAVMVTDSYSSVQQRVFRDGMRKVDAASRSAQGLPFMSATPAQRLAVLTALDQEQKRVMDEREAAERNDGVTAGNDEPPHYFRMMKQLALLGYFTSEIGCTQAQRYVEVPGRFDPCVPYADGEPAWAPHA